MREIKAESFDVRMFRIRRRAGRRRPYRLRWRVGGVETSRSFLTRALAEGYKAELIHAANKGLPFDPGTGKPFAWAPVPEQPGVTWYRHAVGFVDMKWPLLAAHSRASVAEALATVTPCLVLDEAGPSAEVLRAALYGWAFNTVQRQRAELDAEAGKALDWLAGVSLPVAELDDLEHVRRGLQALGRRLDGAPAAPNTVARKRAVFHGALGYAVELGLLAANPLDRVRGQRRITMTPVDDRRVANPRQVRAILTEVAKDYPDLVAFFGWLVLRGAAAGRGCGASAGCV